MSRINDAELERRHYTPEHAPGYLRPRAQSTSSFGSMQVVEGPFSDGRGTRYLCACGWSGWTAFGRAASHARTCGLSDAPPPQLPGLDW